jgi:hypothetical protein
MARDEAAQNLTSRQRVWLEHIRSLEGSGETMKYYADAEGLSVRGFYYHKRLLSKKGLLRVMEGQSVRFQQIEVRNNHVPTCRVEMAMAQLICQRT